MKKQLEKLFRDREMVRVVNGVEYLELAQVVDFAFPMAGVEIDIDVDELLCEDYENNYRDKPAGKLIDFETFKALAKTSDRGSVSMHALALFLGREKHCMCHNCFSTGVGGFFE